jgi:taurine dioxygenase
MRSAASAAGIPGELTMSGLDIEPLAEDLGFGARVRGVTLENITDQTVHEELVALFDKAGLLLFEETEPSGELQVAISLIAGPLKDHLQKTVARVDQDAMPGVIDMVSEPEASAAVEVDGKLLASWLPWHFDHCYNNELNRGGVLRAIEIPPEGGMTGFADGIGLYQALAPDLREQIEGRNILYRMNVIMENFRFGRPAAFKVLNEHPTSYAVMEEMADKPRGVHPAIWTRPDGKKVLHVSSWMAEGIEGAEDAAGDALLDAVCCDIYAKARDHSYFHRWRETDMVLWDNWRLLHAVGGYPPQYRRRMQRTTIRGDYGLGYFEKANSETTAHQTA